MKVYVNAKGKAKVGRRVLQFPAALRGAWVTIEEPAQTTDGGDSEEQSGEEAAEDGG